MTKGPPVPIPPYKGSRYDPPWAWLFAKGYYGPPDGRPCRTYPSLTYEQVRAWMPHMMPENYYQYPPRDARQP